MAEKVKIYMSGGPRYVDASEWAGGDVILASTGEPPAPRQCRACRWYVPTDTVIGRCCIDPCEVPKDSRSFCSRWERGTEPCE